MPILFVVIPIGLLLAVFTLVVINTIRRKGRFGINLLRTDSASFRLEGVSSATASPSLMSVGTDSSRVISPLEFASWGPSAESAKTYGSVLDAMLTPRVSPVDGALPGSAIHGPEQHLEEFPVPLQCRLCQRGHPLCIPGVDVGPARSNTCSASTSARVGQSEVVAVTAQNNVKWFIAATTTPAATMVRIFAAIWAIP